MTILSPLTCQIQKCPDFYISIIGWRLLSPFYQLSLSLHSQLNSTFSLHPCPTLLELSRLLIKGFLWLLSCVGLCFPDLPFPRFSPSFGSLHLFVSGWAGSSLLGRVLLAGQRLFSSCGARTSYCRGFSCHRAGALGQAGFGSCGPLA